MFSAAPTAAIAQPAPDAAAIARLTRARLKELDRLRDVAFNQVEKLGDACKALPREQVFTALLANSGGQIMDFERLARSIARSWCWNSSCAACSRRPTATLRANCDWSNPTGRTSRRRNSKISTSISTIWRYWM